VLYFLLFEKKRENKKTKKKKNKKTKKRKDMARRLSPRADTPYWLYYNGIFPTVRHM
jgi:hypothetical protein